MKLVGWEQLATQGILNPYSTVKPELEQAFNQLCSDVVLHIRVIIAVHLGEVADISGVSVKDSLYRYGVALMCLYNLS